MDSGWIIDNYSDSLVASTRVGWYLVPSVLEELGGRWNIPQHVTTDGSHENIWKFMKLMDEGNKKNKNKILAAELLVVSPDTCVAWGINWPRYFLDGVTMRWISRWNREDECNDSACPCTNAGHQDGIMAAICLGSWRWCQLYIILYTHLEMENGLVEILTLSTGHPLYSLP